MIPPTAQNSSPAAEYRTRLERFEQTLAQATLRYRWLGNARLATGVAALVIAALSLGAEWISPWWLILPIVIFIGLATTHSRVDRELSSASRAAAHYRKALARVENRWVGTGVTGEFFGVPGHLYAEDLDVLGRGGLFELLCTARTATGERTLAEWLLAPAPREVAAARQRAVAELRPRSDLREQIALLGEDIRAAVDDRKLAAWGSAEAVRFFNGARVIAVAFAGAALLTFGLYFSQILSLRPFLYVLLAEAIFGYSVRSQVLAIAQSVNLPARELQLLRQFLERLETEAFASPALDTLRSRLNAEGPRPTEQIRQLERWVERLDWTRNQFFRLIAAPLQWTTLCTIAIEEWRARSGKHIADWITAVGELEALLALAGFAYERPDATFPELIDATAPGFEFSGLVHPLIAAQEAVPNDVALGGEVRLWIVSGSNMSGKSTLLRAVGLATVMAWAGAPVTAAKARLSRLEVGASLRTVDSLTDHRSRFYAEITRLRQILDLARAGKPTLFLLDELLSGTNSQDRRLGAGALLRGLVDRGAIGLATTHDLALASIVEELGVEELGAGESGPRAVNVHLEDHMEGGEMRFDYRLRPGVVERGNALALMRAVGLEV